jgi:ABC-type glutathione transport system ATPase component
MIYELAGVTRAFRSGDRRVEALGGVDLQIAAGEHVAVTGPSGSGKTTLLQLLGALDRPTTGSLHFDGRDLGALRERELTGLRLRGVGFVFQQFNLVPTLSARGNVEAALDPLHLGRAERRRRAQSASTRSGSATARATSPRSCRAASSSASRSRGRWPASRAWCWPTSRPASSTRPPPTRSPACSARSPASGPSSSSRTTLAWPPAPRASCG